jgi:hypothetical protein
MNRTQRSGGRTRKKWVDPWRNAVAQGTGPGGRPPGPQEVRERARRAPAARADVPGDPAPSMRNAVPWES